MTIDPNLKCILKQTRKYLLRKAFEQEKIIPDEILWRPKEAFQMDVLLKIDLGIKLYKNMLIVLFLMK